MYMNVINFLSCPADLKPFMTFIKKGVYPIFLIAIPLLLLFLGMLDLAKAVTAGKEEEVKTAQKLLVKRAISAIAIFFLVSGVSLIMTLIGENSAGENKDATSWSDCWNLKNWK